MIVRAKVPFAYDGREYATGAEIEMLPGHARVFKLIGKVEAVDDEPPPDKRPRHRYGRRDMRAET